MKNSFITFVEERIIIVTLLFSILLCVYPIPFIGQLMLIVAELILAIVIIDFSIFVKKTEILIQLINFFTLFSLPLNFNLVRRAVETDFSEMQMPLMKQLYTIRVNNIGLTSNGENILAILIFISVPVIFLTLYRFLLINDRFSIKIHDFSLYVTQTIIILHFDTLVLGTLSCIYLLIRVLSYVPINTDISQQILTIEFSMWSFVTFILFYPLIIVVLSIGIFLATNSIKSEIGIK